MRRAKWLFEIWLKHSIISDCGVGLRHVYKMSHPLVGGINVQLLFSGHDING